MTPQTARGHVAQFLNAEQIAEVVRFEAEFPEGRPLQPFEIGRKLKIDISKTITQAQDDAMQSVWLDFCKSKDIDQTTTLGDHSLAKEWMLYSIANYHEPMAVVSRKWESI